jgi:hypothetical protein
VIRWLLPRAALAILFCSAALFAFFESVYLRDQSMEFRDGKIALWMWTFRGITAALVIGAAVVFAKK